VPMLHRQIFAQCILDVKGIVSRDIVFWYGWIDLTLQPLMEQDRLLKVNFVCRPKQREKLKRQLKQTDVSEDCITGHGTFLPTTGRYGVKKNLNRCI
jgi:hypothetical protein